MFHTSIHFKGIYKGKAIRMNQQPSSLPWDVHGRQGRQIGQKDSKKTFRNAEGAENKYPRCKQPGPFFQPPPVALHS